MPDPDRAADTVVTPAGTSDAALPAPRAAQAADLGGLLAFLPWVHEHAHLWGRRPKTVETYHTAWRVAHKRLALPADTRIDDLDLTWLAGQIASAGPPGAKRSTAGEYLPRLVICRQWHQRWRAGEPDWWRSTQIPAPAVPRPRTVVHRFPLRHTLTITVELPADLRPDEAELLHTWLRTLATD